MHNATDAQITADCDAAIDLIMVFVVVDGGHAVIPPWIMDCSSDTV